METISLAGTRTLEELYRALEPLSIGPGWDKPTPSLWNGPHGSMLPMRWEYRSAHAALEAAGHLVDTELAERRNLILINPAIGNTYGTSKTLVAAYQSILPGERARTHRHTPNALRLILDAKPGTYTVVDGVELPMNENDVVLTPSWSWHGHGNRSSDPAYWVDYLDVPLVHMLEPMFFELYPGGFEDGAEVASRSPLMYAWSDVGRKLAAAPRDPSGRTARCVPLDEHPLATIALAMIGLDAGETTTPYRTTANNIYTVVQGHGRSVIAEREFSWERGDVFVAPAWSSHFHNATGEAVLFRVSDEPVLAAAGMLRSTE